MSDVTDPIESGVGEVRRMGRRVEDEIDRFDQELRQTVEPRTGASAMQREAERTRERQERQEQQAQEEEQRRRRRRESMTRAAMQPTRSMFDILGSPQGTTDRLG